MRDNEPESETALLIPLNGAPAGVKQIAIADATDNASDLEWIDELSKDGCLIKVPESASVGNGNLTDHLEITEQAEHPDDNSVPQKKETISLDKDGEEPATSAINIRPNDDFSDVKSPVTLTDKEFCYDIWLFEMGRSNQPSLKGLYRDGIIKLLTSYGFYKRYREGTSVYIFIRERDNIMEEVEPCIMQDTMMDYIGALPDTLEFDYRGCKVAMQVEKLRETFCRQSNTIFNDTFLGLLQNHEKKILKDDKECAYFFFKNKIAKVTKDGLESLEYGIIKDACIWKKHIRDLDFTYIKDNSDCHFARFINNVSNQEDDRKLAFRSAIGYLLHNHSHTSQGQAVIAYDEQITDLKNPMGGTGKGIIKQAIAQLREVVKVDGKKFDEKDRFCFQDITEQTQVVFFDDVRPELGFDRFNSILTDGWNVEHKNKPAFFIKPESSPKVYITSNAILEGDGTTRERRQFIIEFSPFYSKYVRQKIEPIKEVHGCLFFDREEWDAEEWNRFYSYMLDCTHYYMQRGFSHYNHRGLKQNQLRQSTGEEFCQWVEEQNFQLNIEYDTKPYYEDFKFRYYGMGDDFFKQRTFTGFLQKYAQSMNWEIIIKRTNSVSKFGFRQSQAVGKSENVIFCDKNKV